MKDKLFLPLFLRTAARFLLFWLIVMGVLTLRNLGTQESLLESRMGEAEDFNLRNCQLVLEGDYDPAIKPAQLEQRLSPYYSMYGAMGVYRLYDVDGQELARSQLTSGSFCLPGTGTYSYHLRFDPVLTEEEHLALARRLREERQLLQFYGTDGGLYDDYLGSDQGINFSVGLRGEVTGVVEANVVYPQKLVYYYEDGPVVLLDTDSDFFDGKELTTLTFDAARISSPLIWSDTSPELALELFREAEARVDSLTADQPPSTNQASTLSGRSGSAHVGPSATLNGIIAASGVAYRPARMALHGLEAVYVGTLLLALLLAVVLGSPSSKERFASATAMLDYGFATFEAGAFPQIAGRADTLRVTGGVEQQVALDYTVPEKMLLKKGEGQTLTAAVVLPEKLDAPVAAGTQVASVTLKAGEEILGEYPVTTRSEVPQMDWGTALSLLTKALFTL